MKQSTVADSGFEIANKKTRKRIFVKEVNAVVPCPDQRSKYKQFWRQAASQSRSAAGLPLEWLANQYRDDTFEIPG